VREKPGDGQRCEQCAANPDRRVDLGGRETRHHHLLKYGLEPNYWNEFVFKAYHHHQHDAIFLTGIPDLQATLPHA
jgi:hypothetical protein